VLLTTSDGSLGELVLDVVVSPAVEEGCTPVVDDAGAALDDTIVEEAIVDSETDAVVEAIVEGAPDVTPDSFVPVEHPRTRRAAHAETLGETKTDRSLAILVLRAAE
jgi:hypothetical protein